MKQISVVVDDKVGLLADISFILGKSHINIESIASSSVGGKCVLNLTVKEEKRAIDVLAANGYKCLESDVIVVQMDNTPGTLAQLTRLLADSKINIENLLILTQDDKRSVYALKVDKPKLAEKLLTPYLGRDE